MNLILIRGLPGSGKTTMAKSLYRGYDHHEADHYFEELGGFVASDLPKAHAQCLLRAIQSMDQSRPCVVSNTFTQIWEMMPYIEAAERRGYGVKVVEAIGNYPNVHNVPAATIERMRERWEEWKQPRGEKA